MDNNITRGIDPFIKIRILILFTLFISTNIFGQELNPSVVQKVVQDKIEQYPDDFHSIYILFEDQIDYNAMERLFVQNNVTVEERSTKTILALQEKATTTQTSMLRELEQNTLVRQSSIRPFWLANSIFFDAKKELITQLSNRPEIAWIGYNSIMGMTETVSIGESTSEFRVQPDSTEPGLIAVNAPALWEKGYTGYGTTAFINDTGVYPFHPSIFSNFEGHIEADDNDFYEFSESENYPFDCGDHGTHVCGTTLGLDRVTKDTIGVAFNANWIGAAILCGVGTADNVGAFQWSLDRDGDPNTADYPDIINNSWRDLDMIPGEDCQSIYIAVMQAMELAGIAVIFSAGNEGPEEMTITAPHNVNIDTLNTFTVAATSVFFPYNVANFSSRGPSECGGEGSLLIKPEVAAPGVNVRSCVPTGYDNKSGTSMAAPHTSGVVLLLKEAFPYLTGRTLLNAVYQTCTDLGEMGEDNIYGRGMINAGAAFEFLVSQGNEPVPPVVTDDLVMVNVFASQIACDNEVDGLVIFENDGFRTINSLEIEYHTTLSDVQTYNWTGELGVNEQLSIQLPSFYAPEGDQNFTVRVKNPNGTADLRPLNNQMILRMTVSSDEQIVAYVDDYIVCNNSNVIVKTSYQGDGNVHWFDAEREGNLIGIGQFLEMEVATSTNVFADIVFNKNIGLSSTETGTSFVEEDLNAALIFDCYAPFTLKEITVYYESSGGREISLFDNNGEKINSKILLLFGSGSERVDLNFDIEPGENYYLALTDGKSLVHNTSGADFPYEIPNILSIKSGVLDTFNFNENYYFFYDWEVEYHDICGRRVVEIETTSSFNDPQSIFTTSVDTIYLSEMNNFTIENQSIDAIEWFWDFGDGTTSTEENPTHAYQTEGSYFVSLSVLNAEGCSDASAISIEVVNDLVSTQNITQSSTIKLYPNPTSNIIHIEFEEKNEFEQLLVMDAVGKIHQQLDIAANHNELSIQFDQYAVGLYYLYFRGKNGIAVKKIIKQ